MFERTEDLASTPARETALASLRAGVEAAHPERVVAEAVSLSDDVLAIADATYDLSAYDRILVVGGGKAADGVASALSSVLDDRLSAGAVVTPDPPSPTDADGPIERLPGDHPVPSAAGVESTRRVRDLVADADERTLVLVAVTGGGSALLPAPAEGVSLEALRKTTDALLDAGADIEDLNAVRKHLSTLKGGGLARLAAPATVVGLAFSDVVGDDLGVIASGPTAPDPTTYADALAVLDRYAVEPPDAVRERLERGADGDLPETPLADDPVFDRVENHVLASAYTALDAAADEARDRGYEPCLLSSRVRGEAREAARTHAAVASEVVATGAPLDPPAVVLAGGECTVTVRGDGSGGPNQEFALSAALDLRGIGEGVALAAADTDGIDGGSDAAGGLVDGATLDAPAAVRLARMGLSDSDAGGALDDLDALLVSGPTGTNVNDLRLAVIEGDTGDDRTDGH